MRAKAGTRLPESPLAEEQTEAPVEEETKALVATEAEVEAEALAAMETPAVAVPWRLAENAPDKAREWAKCVA